MSGGSLNYFYSYLEEHSDDLGDKELNHLVSDLAELYHDREWYLSGDYGKGQWIEARDAFKQKWFTEHGRQERVEQYLQEFCDEIRETFGMKTERCKTCKHWSQAKDDSPWGNCEFVDRDEAVKAWRKTEEANMQLSGKDATSDLIYRQAAVDALYNYWSDSSFDGDGYVIADKSEDVLRDLPSAEPERKKGKWIGKEQFANSPEFYSWQCSVCGCVLEDPTLGKPYPFCPNCGSFNGGEQE